MLKLADKPPSQNDRIPPHDFAAEMAALGSVFVRPANIDELADLAVDDFYLPAHREILDAMRAVVERRRALDVLTVREELQARGVLAHLEDGEAYLTRIANETPASSNVAHYARIVSDKATLRKLIAACAEVMSVAYGDPSDPDETIAEARAKISALEVRASGGPVRVGDDIDRVVRDIEARGQRPQEYVVPSGLRDFDERIGGFRAEKLVVIAANPGRGKSSFAWNVAVRAALRQIPTIVFSLEMSRAELIERAIAQLGRVNSFAVARGRLHGNDWNGVHQAIGMLTPIPLWVDTRKLTANRICSEVRRWRSRQRTPRALVVVDYLGLVRNERPGETRNREVGEMSRAFKRLAGEDQANAPILLCAQLNRENMKGGQNGQPRTPMLADLRDSGEIEQDADMVIFPWWEGKAPLTGKHPAELRVAKHRGGPTDNVPVYWEPEFTTFSDFDDDWRGPRTPYNETADERSDT